MNETVSQLQTTEKEREDWFSDCKQTWQRIDYVVNYPPKFKIFQDCADLLLNLQLSCNNLRTLFTVKFDREDIHRISQFCPVYVNSIPVFINLVKPGNATPC